MSTATLDRVKRSITPEDGEDQPAFAVRFHSAMQKAIPDTDARNAAMFDAWFDAGDELLDEAEETFTPDRYFRRAAPVCEFDEHVADHEDGGRTHYDRDTLVGMCRTLNSRIEDTGDFGVLTDGHTSDEEGAPQPEIVGTVGPWYLGQVGHKSPRWALFATEHYRRDRADRIKELPRRSVEILRDLRRPASEWIIDPVAAISETPRRNLGMVRYSQDGPGIVRERYSMAAAMPSATNTHVTTDRYSDEDDGPAVEDADMPDLSEAAINAIAQRCTEQFMQLPEVQFVRSLMQAGDDDADTPADEAAEDAGDAAVGDMDPDREPDGDEDGFDVDGDGDGIAPPDTPDTPEMPELSDEDAGAGPDEDTGDMSKVQELEARIAQLEKQLADTSTEKRELYRRDTLRTMKQRGVLIDVDDEMSLTADFSDEQFDRYSKQLPKTRARVPLANVVDPLPEGQEVGDDAPVSGMDPKMEKYSRAAVEHVKRERAAGRPCDYADTLKQLIAAGE